METQSAIKSDWHEIKGKIKARFEKLNDDAIESAKDNLELLSSKIQTAYGYAKEHAERELAGFKASLHTATAPEKTETKETETKI
jgi:uncharacterized protein YjbJ (UPF0337 family)